MSNFKGTNVTTINRSTSDNSIGPENRHKRHTYQSELFESLSNDRDIPDFLGQSDDEDFHILTDKDSTIMCSRSTQTLASSIQNEPRFSPPDEFGFPSIILGGHSGSMTSNQFHREMMLTRSQLNSVHHNYQTLKTHFHKLYADYHKLMGIAAELTESLENSVRGTPVDIRTTLQACMKIYPDIFDKNIRESDKMKLSTIGSQLDHFDKNRKITMLSTVPFSAKEFNYKKIKLHLINGSIRTKLLLLQALRWKITLSQPGERDETIIEYIHSDLLGLYGQIAGDSGKSILPYILIPLDVVSPHPVQQSAARLLNTFASFKCGRDYLAIGPNILNVVIQCIDNTHAESIDAFTCDMIIATLQKLSLRKLQRLYMISAGMIEWLIHHLKAECCSMSTYRLEYATALLMNLSLHKEAQTRAEAIAPILLSTLIALLSLDHLRVLPYVYSALNNFLYNSVINEEANIIGLKAILDYHRNYRTGELREHLDHILLRYRQKFNYRIEEDISDNDDDCEEHDVVEDELDEMDPVKVQAGELFGEALLVTCYSTTSNIIPTNKKEIIVHSSSDLSHKIDNEFDPDHRNEKLLKNHYLSYCSEKLSPRLTTLSYQSEFPNLARLNIVSRIDVDRKSNDKNDKIIFNDQDEKKLIDLRLYFSKNLDKKYGEKVNNSLNESWVDKGMISSKKSERMKTSEINTSTLWDMSINETDNFIQPKVSYSQHLSHELTNSSRSTLCIYSNKTFEESSMTVVNSGMNTSSTIANSVFEGTEVVEDTMGSMASLDINVNERTHRHNVIELMEEEEDAFAAKPRISRTPPQSVSDAGFSVLIGSHK